MLKACKDWNYPDTVTRSDVTMATEEIFYEGDFLHMLLDKLSHLLDQVGTALEAIHMHTLTGRGSSVGSDAIWDASGTEIDPRLCHIL